jgi:uncharacterized protein YndB with AHSA1/START domain
MIESSRRIPVPADRVFAVLADGWSYADWVVGAAKTRDVDAGWPAVGTRLHHRVGLWPLQLDDVTVVRAVEPDRLLELDGHLWVLGTARIRFRLEPTGDGTLVRMEEHVDTGPGALVPDAAQALFIRPRNAETLRRLERVTLHQPAR